MGFKYEYTLVKYWTIPYLEGSYMPLSCQYSYAIWLFKSVFKMPWQKLFYFHIEKFYTKANYIHIVLVQNVVRR